MGQLLPFPSVASAKRSARLRRRSQDASGRGQVLLWTGVRIERHASVDEMKAVRLKYDRGLSSDIEAGMEAHCAMASTSVG